VNPAVAVFLGWLFLGEHVGGREIAAGLVILTSVAMLLLSREPRARTETRLRRAMSGAADGREPA